MSEERFQYPAVRPESKSEVTTWPIRVAICMANEDHTDMTAEFVQVVCPNWRVRSYKYIRHLIEDFDDWEPHAVVTHWHGYVEDVRIGSELVSPNEAPFRFAKHIRLVRGENVRTRPVFVADYHPQTFEGPNAEAMWSAWRERMPQAFDALLCMPWDPNEIISYITRLVFMKLDVEGEPREQSREPSRDM